MTIIETIIMGILQGIAEFFPISSSGHIVFYQKVANIDATKGMFLDTLLHIATLIAVIIYFREDVVNICREFMEMVKRAFINLVIFYLKKKSDNKHEYVEVVNSSYKKLIIMLAISTFVTALIGIFGQALVMSMRNSTVITGIFFMVTAVMLFLTDRRKDGEQVVKSANYTGSVFLGLAQGVSIIPGLSRTASTIFVGNLLGYNNKLAVKYSFLMSIPAMLGSTIYRFIYYGGKGFDRGLIPGYFFAMVIAGFVSFYAIKLMMKLVKNKKYIYYSIYSFIIGFAAIIFSIVTLN